MWCKCTLQNLPSWTISVIHDCKRKKNDFKLVEIVSFLSLIVIFSKESKIFRVCVQWGDTNCNWPCSRNILLKCRKCCLFRINYFYFKNTLETTELVLNFFYTLNLPLYYIIRWPSRPKRSAITCLHDLSALIKSSVFQNVTRI